MVIKDIAQVIYAPQKAFKKIIENPKYLGIIIILVLFIGLQIGYEFSQISKTQIEQISPPLGYSATFLNTTMWSAGANTGVNSNFGDYFNYTVYEAGYGYYPALFGNSSLAITSSTPTASATLNLAQALSSIPNNIDTNVDCSAPSGFQNLSFTIKQTAPTAAPQNATLTLYSLGNSNTYTYDLTPTLSNLTANGAWNNYTISVGPNAKGWTENGAPLWSNITALNLQFTYPSGSNVSLNIGALYFHGEYQTLIQLNSTGFLLNFLQQFSLQFLFTWFLMSVLFYVFFKGLKTPVTWKPVFVALGFAMVVMVIRALVNIIATLTLPTLYYPFDVWPGLSLTPYGTIFYPSGVGTTLFSSSQAAIASNSAAATTYASITVSMFFISYVWLAIMATMVISAYKPEFSPVKRIGIAAVSVAVTLLALLLLGVGA